MQSALLSTHGVSSSLKRRPEEKNGEQTWMETYHAAPEDFLVTLDAAASSATAHSARG